MCKLSVTVLTCWASILVSGCASSRPAVIDIDYLRIVQPVDKGWIATTPYAPGASKIELSPYAGYSVRLTAIIPAHPVQVQRLIKAAAGLNDAGVAVSTITPEWRKGRPQVQVTYSLAGKTGSFQTALLGESGDLLFGGLIEEAFFVGQQELALSLREDLAAEAVKYIASEESMRKRGDESVQHFEKWRQDMCLRTMNFWTPAADYQVYEVDGKTFKWSGLASPSELVAEAKMPLADAIIASRQSWRKAIDEAIDAKTVGQTQVISLKQCVLNVLPTGMPATVPEPVLRRILDREQGPTVYLPHVAQ